ncbi:MAG: hypothetical protein D3M94_02255 [Rhodocyclales bacterium GT-UBC]|nr:MAG: hypothetical protein D3M94_02255 [Rhodocyclales bacterium GT-UBC]
MNLWIRSPVACLLAILCDTSVAAPPRTEFEQGFIGRQWVSETPVFDPYPFSGQCKHLESQDLQRNQKRIHGFRIDYFNCNGRGLYLLEQSIGDGKVKVVDALHLPRFKPGERYMMTGDCEINGNTDTDFIAVVRLGRREKVDWKTGIRAAWAPKPETGKIEELSTRDIVCWRMTPP